MANNKINMSLDEIIKKERTGNNEVGNKAIRKGRPNFVRRRLTNSKLISARRNSGNTGNRGNSAAALNVVNGLVKRAIQQRANQSFRRTAAMHSRRGRGMTTMRLAGLKGMRNHENVAASRLAQRLSGVSQRSRLIKKRTLGNRNQSQIVRGRGIARMGQLVSDEVPVIIQERKIFRPNRQRQIVQTVPIMQPRREVLMQRRNRPVFIQRQQPFLVQRGGGVHKRFVVRQQPIVALPQRQLRSRQIFQRVGNNGVAVRNRFVRRGNTFQGINPNAEQFKAAFGIGSRTRPERFESSSTFLQRIPVASRRGRQFVIYE